MDIIVSIPPTAPFLHEIARIECVSGFRYNTGVQARSKPMDELANFKRAIGDKTMWIDLKCREIKVKESICITPESRVIEIDKDIVGKLPMEVYYNEGNDWLLVSSLTSGNHLTVHLPPGTPPDFEIRLGKGASLNIPGATVTSGYLTRKDRMFVDAAMELGLHDYCLSYVEQGSDIDELLALDPEANIIAKIESPRGIQFVSSEFKAYENKARLMAARGDLYAELERPHEILGCLKHVIAADRDAIGASRLFQSLLGSEIPSCADICDMGFMMGLGYDTFLLGDLVCDDLQLLKSIIGLMTAIHQDYLKA